MADDRDDPRPSTRRILLVDDEPAILRALTRLFTRNGFEVRAADSVADALVVLDGFTPDVVLSDFKMPARNGGELLAVVGERFPAAKRILLSGYADHADDPGILFMHKPYDVDALLEACR